MNGKEDDIAVLFSGGSDSTLAAALMCMRFRKVHLLTCGTSFIYDLQKSKANAKLLQNRFGKDKVTHEFLESGEIFKAIYLGNYLHDLNKFKTYRSACVCAACSLSWHVRAVLYDFEHDIHFTCDGERYEDPPIWAEQMPDVLEMVRDFYKEYGIVYENPVYHIRRTDWRLFELGITSERDVKLEGLAHDGRSSSKEPWVRWRSTQPNCYGGIVGSIFLSGCFIPMRGQRENEKLAIEYYKDKLGVCRKYIQKHLKNCELNEGFSGKTITESCDSLRLSERNECIH